MKRLRVSEETYSQIVAFVEVRYQKLPNKELQQLLCAKFPEVDFPAKAVQSICSKHRFIRTKEERAALMARLVEAGVKRNAVLKQHEANAAKVGDIKFTTYSCKKQWIIKLGTRKHMPYAKYLWLQSHGKIPGGYRVEWIDPDSELTNNNLRLIKYVPDTIPIGGITTWKNGNRRRPLIKVAEGKYELLLPHLWRKHNGEIPPGKFVEVIDPFKPITINNLRLTQQDEITTGAKTLKDWFVKANLKSMGFKKDEIPDSLIKVQRAKIELRREIKKHKNAKTTTGRASDNEVAGPST